MAALTWRNVDAPDLGQVAQMQGMANQSIQQAFNAFSEIANRRLGTAEKELTEMDENQGAAFNAALSRLQTSQDIQDAEASGLFDQMMAGMSGGARNKAIDAMRQRSDTLSLQEIDRGYKDQEMALRERSADQADTQLDINQQTANLQRRQQQFAETRWRTEDGRIAARLKLEEEEANLMKDLANRTDPNFIRKQSDDATVEVINRYDFGNGRGGINLEAFDAAPAAIQEAFKNDLLRVSPTNYATNAIDAARRIGVGLRTDTGRQSQEALLRANTSIGVMAEQDVQVLRQQEEAIDRRYQLNGNIFNDANPGQTVQDALNEFPIELREKLPAGLWKGLGGLSAMGGTISYDGARIPVTPALLKAAILQAQDTRWWTRTFNKSDPEAIIKEYLSSSGVDIAKQAGNYEEAQHEKMILRTTREQYGSDPSSALAAELTNRQRRLQREQQQSNNSRPAPRDTRPLPVRANDFLKDLLER